MGANEDRMIQMAAAQALQGGISRPQPQQQSITFDQMLQMCMENANRTGASLQGWAMFVEQGILTPEQVFNIVFKNDIPQVFEAKPKLSVMGNVMSIPCNTDA